MAYQYSPLCPNEVNPRKRRQVENLNPVSVSYSLSTPIVPHLTLERPLAVPSPLLEFTNLLSDNRTAEIVDQSEEIADIIRENAEELQNKLNEKWMRNFYAVESAAEERVWKKMKEFGVEMDTMRGKLASAEEKVEHLRFEKNIWEAKCRDLEDEVRRMRRSVFMSRWARTYPKEEEEEEEEEESWESSSRSRVKICKVCGEE